MIRFFLVSGLLTTALTAQAESRNLLFPAPEITAQGQNSHVVKIEGLMNTMAPQTVSLPVQTIYVALPDAATLSDIHLTTGPVTHVDNINVAVSGGVLPLSFGGKVPVGLPKSPANFASSGPNTWIETEVALLHGVRIAIISVYPVLTNATGGIDYVTELTLDLPQGKISRDLTVSQAQDLQKLVTNRDVIVASSLESDGYDYLVITTETLQRYAGPASIQDLTQDLNAHGLKTKVVTMEEIKAAEKGRDVAEKVRHRIQSEYTKNNIRYVLLLGDGDDSGSGALIPTRRFAAKVNAYDGQWRVIEASIPSDQYYSCLDGDFNGNGNAVWGETTDGEGGGDVDFLCEVAVGRLPADSIADLQNMISKTLQARQSERNGPVLQMGEELFANIYGDDYMETLIGESRDHDFTTQGYSNQWNIDRLYDRTGAWSGTTALKQINQGQYWMINHIGHSNVTYNMRLSSMMWMPKFTNATPFFYYTEGCFPGNFTANDSFIEKLMKGDKGSFAAVANTSYGLAPEDPQPEQTKTPGASLMLHRQFIDQALKGKDIGTSHLQSKAAFVGLKHTDEIRWVTWDANLFGDPSLKLVR